MRPLEDIFYQRQPRSRQVAEGNDFAPQYQEHTEPTILKTTWRWNPTSGIWHTSDSQHRMINLEKQKHAINSYRFLVTNWWSCNWSTSAVLASHCFQDAIVPPWNTPPLQEAMEDSSRDSRSEWRYPLRCGCGSWVLLLKPWSICQQESKMGSHIMPHLDIFWKCHPMSCAKKKQESW